MRLWPHRLAHPSHFAVTRSDNYGQIALGNRLFTLPTAPRVQPVYQCPWSPAETAYQ
jgi:hypothetical protein